MSSTTPNFKLVKDVISDNVGQTLTDLAGNMNTIDTELQNRKNETASQATTLADHTTQLATHDTSITSLQNKYGSGVSTTVQDYTWIATQGQTVFTLPSGQTYQPKSNTIWVTVGGMPQSSGSGFTETSTTQFTLAEGLNSGTVVEARWFDGVGLSSGLMPNVTDLPGYSTNVQPINSGVTSSRPTSVPVGFMFYDSTLNKPVWYKGSTVWVDATGTSV